MASVTKANGVNVVDSNGIGAKTFICAVTGSEPVTAAELNAAVAALSAQATVAGVSGAGSDTVYVAVQGGNTPDVSGVDVIATF